MRGKARKALAERTDATAAAAHAAKAEAERVAEAEALAVQEEAAEEEAEEEAEAEAAAGGDGGGGGGQAEAGGGSGSRPGSRGGHGLPRHGAHGAYGAYGAGAHSGPLALGAAVSLSGVRPMVVPRAVLVGLERERVRESHQDSSGWGGACLLTPFSRSLHYSTLLIWSL